MAVFFNIFVSITVKYAVKKKKNDVTTKNDEIYANMCKIKIKFLFLYFVTHFYTRIERNGQLKNKFEIINILTLIISYLSGKTIQTACDASGRYL